MSRINIQRAIRRPHSPDTELEVAASRDEYESVLEVLENENIRYPQVLYDSTRQMAIVVAAPSPIHSDMTGCILTNIREEAIQLHQMARNLTHAHEETTTRSTTHGNTTRANDGALIYTDRNNSYTLMVAVEIGFSQDYGSLRAAISWSVCALRCRVGIAMSIQEGMRRQTPPIRYYVSIKEIRAAVEGAKEAFLGQLAQHRYGPLVWDGVTWFGRVKQVVLETYRCQDEDILPDTVLNPSQSFVIVSNGQFEGHDMPANLRELVLGDCIPSHVLIGNEVRATPVNFFRRDWFESKFSAAMLRTAVQRVWGKSEVRTQQEPS
ncbi:hypothetical protein V1521DRAFT_464385 [Lipomyces starkeyi]